MRRNDVVVVGSLNADLVVTALRRPGTGETVLGESFAVMPGGKGANQALAAALVAARTDRLEPSPVADTGVLEPSPVARGDSGVPRVALIGAVGDDANASVVLRELVAAGVDLSGVERLAGVTTGVASIIVDGEGDNSIVVVPGANGHVTAELVRAHADRIAGAAVTVVQMEIPLDGTSAVAELATGRMIVNLAPALPVPPSLLRRADPLVVNEHEAATARGILMDETAGAPSAALPQSADHYGDATTAIATTPDTQPTTTTPTTRVGESDRAPDRLAADRDDEADCVADLLAAGVPSVVLTLGARGCLAGDANGITRIPAVRVRPVDTTGAGDAFTGALAARLAAGDTLVGACRFATRVAAYSTLRPGAQPSYPSPADDLP